jgi:phenylacetate-coenzyme A ligase PaaK-like adenylate-forming protein
MSAASEPLIWDPAEQLPRDDLRALQLERLRSTFGLDLASLDDVGSLPFTTKSALRGRIPMA